MIQDCAPWEPRTISDKVLGQMAITYWREGNSAGLKRIFNAVKVADLAILKMIQESRS